MSQMTNLSLTRQVHPQVVCVEDLELLDRLEVLFMVFGHLGHLQKAQLSSVLDQGSSLNVSPEEKIRYDFMARTLDCVNKK